MKKVFKDSKAASLLAGKGFYIALALSIAMVGAACYFAYTQNKDSITGQLDSAIVTEESSKSEQNVWDRHTDIPKVTFGETHTAPQETTAAAPETKPQETDKKDDKKSSEASKPGARKMVMPLEGEVLVEFSNGELVKSGTTGVWQTHNGVDIKASLGDSVCAVDSGTVSAVEEDPLWGYCVTIDHGNGVVTRYCNLNKGITVQTGQEVSSGEEIGAVGETADIETNEEAHLHFEMTKNGSYVDPIKAINK